MKEFQKIFNKNMLMLMLFNFLRFHQHQHHHRIQTDTHLIIPVIPCIPYSQNTHIHTTINNLVIPLDISMDNWLLLVSFQQESFQTK